LNFLYTDFKNKPRLKQPSDFKKYFKKEGVSAAAAFKILPAATTAVPFLLHTAVHPRTETTRTISVHLNVRGSHPADTRELANRVPASPGQAAPHSQSPAPQDDGAELPHAARGPASP